jgi:hypothetical protein
MKSRPDSDPVFVFLQSLGVDGFARGGMINPRDIRSEILRVADMIAVCS